MENPLLLFPQLNISASKDKPYYKVMKPEIKEEPNKASQPGAKQKRNRLSLLLQKPEFHESDHLGKPGNLTKAARFFKIDVKHVQLDRLDDEHEEFYKLGTVSQNHMAFGMFVVNKPDYTCYCPVKLTPKPYCHSFFCSVSPEEAVKWGESFDKLLSEKAGLDAFTKFLKTEFSEENIEFWIACEDYKKSKSAHELLPKAKSIFETFIQKDAPKEVNLDFHTKEVTSQSMGQPLRSTFDAAQSTVYRLMEQDSYPRFLRSAAYRGLLRGRPVARGPLRRRSRSFTVSDFQGVRPNLTVW